MHAEILVLHFSTDIVDQPIIYRLVKDFDLEFNLLKATIYPRKEGVMVLELRGHPKNFKNGVKFLKDAGVKVQRVASEVQRNDERCYQCGTCTAVCPTGALYVKRPEMEVVLIRISAAPASCVVRSARPRPWKWPLTERLFLNYAVCHSSVLNSLSLVVRAEKRYSIGHPGNTLRTSVNFKPC